MRNLSLNSSLFSHVIINLLFNLITKNMLYYKKFYCNLKNGKKKNSKNGYIVLPYYDSNYALYKD